MEQKSDLHPEFKSIEEQKKWLNKWDAKGQPRLIHDSSKRVIAVKDHKPIIKGASIDLGKNKNKLSKSEKKRMKKIKVKGLKNINRKDTQCK